MFDKLVLIAAGYVLFGSIYEKGKEKGKEAREKEIAILLAKRLHGIDSVYDQVKLEEIEKKGERYLGIR